MQIQNFPIGGFFPHHHHHYYHFNFNISNENDSKWGWNECGNKTKRKKTWIKSFFFNEKCSQISQENMHTHTQPRSMPECECKMKKKILSCVFIYDDNKLPLIKKAHPPI